MTDHKMPDEIWIDSEDGNDDCVYTSQWRKECVKYVRNDLYTAVVAERDALLALCERMAGALEKTQKELLVTKDDAFCEHEVGICSCGYWDAVECAKQSLAAYEKHKGGE